MPDHTSDHTLAYVCIHVFEDTRPVLLVSRQEGDWCFLCGGEHEQKAENYRVVGRGHILARDAALHQLTDLAQLGGGAAIGARPLDPPADTSG